MTLEVNQPTDFVAAYSDLILKKIVAGIVSNRKKQLKAEAIAMSTAKTAQQVRSMRHWRAVSDTELYYKEIRKGFHQMNELDYLTRWTQKLHQERFNFLHSKKYAGVLNQYLTTYGRV